MARTSKTAAVDYTNAQYLTHGLLERATCPADLPFVLVRDSDKKGLRLRVTKAGGKHWQFETRIKGKLFTRALGGWPAVSLDSARKEAHRLRGLTEAGTDPRDAEREIQTAKEVEKATAIQNKTYTLEKLLNEYCDYLKSLGRISHSAARSIFKVHVFEPWPKVAALPANKVTGEQIADMMRKTIEAGKDRTANKLRSYIRAAYQVAKASRSKAGIPLAFKAFNVKSNPAGDTEPDESANRADKRPFTADELKTYWQAIKPMPGFIGAVLRLHLLTGGQRIEQLTCLLTANVSPDSITLFDSKGRPGKAPRPHTVPLVPAAAAAMLVINAKGAFALSMDGGKSRLGERTISDWSKAAGACIVDFQAKRIRSGVETLLASKRISSDIRGRLQSHGISGVQARHYDGHEYMDEKREALETLFKVLEGLPLTEGKVVQLKAA
jgi:integrase